MAVVTETDRRIAANEFQLTTADLDHGDSLLLKQRPSSVLPPGIDPSLGLEHYFEELFSISPGELFCNGATFGPRTHTWRLSARISCVNTPVRTDARLPKGLATTLMNGMLGACKPHASTVNRRYDAFRCIAIALSLHIDRIVTPRRAAGCFHRARNQNYELTQYGRQLLERCRKSWPPKADFTPNGPLCEEQFPEAPPSEDGLPSLRNGPEATSRVLESRTADVPPACQQFNDLHSVGHPNEAPEDLVRLLLHVPECNRSLSNVLQIPILRGDTIEHVPVTRVASSYLRPPSSSLMPPQPVPQAEIVNPGICPHQLNFSYLTSGPARVFNSTPAALKRGGDFLSDDGPTLLNQESSKRPKQDMLRSPFEAVTALTESDRASYNANNKGCMPDLFTQCNSFRSSMQMAPKGTISEELRSQDIAIERGEINQTCLHWDPVAPFDTSAVAATATRSQSLSGNNFLKALASVV